MWVQWGISFKYLNVTLNRIVLHLFFTPNALCGAWPDVMPVSPCSSIITTLFVYADVVRNAPAFDFLGTCLKFSYVYISLFVAIETWIIWKGIGLISVQLIIDWMSPFAPRWNLSVFSQIEGWEPCLPALWSDFWPPLCRTLHEQERHLLRLPLPLGAVRPQEQPVDASPCDAQGETFALRCQVPRFFRRRWRLPERRRQSLLRIDFFNKKSWGSQSNFFFQPKSRRQWGGGYRLEIPAPRLAGM